MVGIDDLKDAADLRLERLPVVTNFFGVSKLIFDSEGSSAHYIVFTSGCSSFWNIFVLSAFFIKGSGL